MILKKVILSNISSYEGYNEFDFSVTDDKNVILIGGKNGAGKTSLFNAIKLGLYGPLNYNYQDVHAQYLSRIKDIITKRAFTQDTVNAYIIINFDYIQDREKVTYEIKRSWEYVNQKIVETLEIKQNGILLNQDELLYFENFLKTVLPPHLFSLFFFDGEELSDIFVGSRFNHYIKEAFLILCNFDTFDLIKKYSQNYVSRNSSSSKTDDLTKDYETIIDTIANHHQKLELNELELNASEHRLNKFLEQKIELNTQFKNAGGLSEQEKESILAEIKKNEDIKEDQSYIIRNFLEDMHPFLIIKKLSSSIAEQIDKEQSHLQKQSTINLLNSHNLEKSILDALEASNIKELSSSQKDILSSTIKSRLLSDISSGFETKDFNIIQNLSNEQLGQVSSMTQKIQQFNTNSIFEAINNRRSSQQITIALNEKLRNSMPEDVVSDYIAKLEKVNLAIIEQEKNVAQLTASISNITSEIKTLEDQKNKLYIELKSATQGESIYELTSSINSMLSEFLKQSSANKIKQLQHYFIENFSLLFSKKNFIDDIEIDDNFNINVYRKKFFSYAEVERLISNLGPIEFAKYVGPKSLDVLYKTFLSNNVSSVNSLAAALKKEVLIGQEIEIYEKINLNQLSKGEKQIYVLSLYWGLIRLSSHEVPFVIDTPYARIDTEHRDNITTKFLPNIGQQVIVLSTDEEIDQTYYNMLKPHIAQEYLLVFNPEEKKTDIHNRYFYEVKS